VEGNSKKRDDILKEELERIVDAIYSLLPSENKISQLAFLAEGQDFTTMRETFPEMLKSRETRETVLDIVGLMVSERGIISKAYGKNLRDILTPIFSTMDDKNFRNTLSVAIGKPLSSPSREWLASRIDGLVESSKEDKTSKNALIVLKAMQEVFKRLSRYYVLEEELGEAVKEYLDSDELSTVLDRLRQYKLIEFRGTDEERRIEFSDDLRHHADLVADINIE
jgi:hypothetical protein